MVFSNIIRQAKYSHQHEKILFFQSSHPYLHNNHSLIAFHQFFNRKWSNEEPHPSSSPLRNFLSIDNGHYGLYYAIFNQHDAERKKRPQRPNEAILEHMINCEILLKFYYPYEYLNVSTKFFILKFNQDIYNNINQIKNMTRAFLSTLSIRSHNVPYIKIAYQNQFITYARNFSTTTPAANQITIENFPQQIKAIKTDDDEIENHPTVTAPEVSVESPFETTLLNTQITSIIDIYSNSSAPEDLNIIYPLYQSLKRNGIKLPSIDLYNVILNSIVLRSLDSQVSLEAIESKLTNLLTIYQDILQNAIKPNFETYNLILNSLFDGAFKVASLPKTNLYALDALNNKEHEFSTIGLDLFNSISNIDQLNLQQLLPKMLPILIHNPTLINKGLVTKIIPYLNEIHQTGQYYLDTIALSKFLTKHNIFDGDISQTYTFIVSTYSSFKDAEIADVDQFDIYSKLIETLVHNNFFTEASKFLDDILVDYKESLRSTVKPKQAQISMIISTYISAIVDSNDADLDVGFDLLMKFNKITYIPELSIELYNNLITKYADRYVQLEVNKAKLGEESIELFTKSQKSSYERLWFLYNHMAIRRDYQATSTIELVNGSNSSQLHCRDVLLSLSINQGDHERIFQLIKEILLKNHLVLDLNAFKKLLNYLYNGVIYNANGEPFNQYYFGLIWNLLETQSAHYTTPVDLNNFISEFISYMMIGNATVETNEYNIKLFLNSPMVSKAVKNFDLTSDNIYGLIVISRTLMGYHGNDNSVFKAILQFQSRLIQQFEDTENHYIEFNEEIVNFKVSIRAHFANLMESLETTQLQMTPEIVESCKICDVVVSQDLTQEGNSLELNYDLNLTYLLNVNYQVGEEKFVELFVKGYRFNSLTWGMILNYNFLLNQLENSRRINIQDLLARLWILNFDDRVKLEHLQSIVNFNSDKVNIQVIKFLNSHKMQPEANDLYSSLIRSVSGSSNIYLKNLLAEKVFFASSYSANQTGTWVTEYLGFLNQENHFSKVENLVESYELFPQAKEYDERAINVLVAYLNALLKGNNLEKFNVVFKQSLKGSEVLNKSPALVELLLNYYISLGSHKHIDLAINTFGKFENYSQTIKESLLYAKLVRHLNDLSVETSGEIQTAASISEYSLRLLANDLSGMKELYDLNKTLLSNKANKNILISSIIDNLIKLSPVSNSVRVIGKFQSVLKYFKLSGLRSFTVDQLCQVITLMRVNNSSEILNILLHKLISNNSTSSEVVNFYFMETILSNDKDKLKVLKALFEAFERLEDPINIYNIQEYCKTNNLVF